uniref:Uncharacterized protein n=1 Tax=Amphimedon queenslandica TaxID=400682 RepID=A0A1X7V8K3_AMPQE
MSTEYYLSLKDVERNRYKEKVKAISKQEFSNEVDLYNISLWLSVEYGNIYKCLTKTPRPFSMKELKAYKNLEAYNYYIREK